MRSLPLLIVFICISIVSPAQNPGLEAFENLAGRTWVANGKWKDGSIFKQEVSLKYALDSTLVIAETRSFTDEQQKEFGIRNHGIRKYDATKGEILFWEFDIFNNLTEGKVIVEGKNIYYIYTYGRTLVTDGWEYIDADTYRLKVGIRAGGDWETTYLDIEVKAAD